MICVLSGDIIASRKITDQSIWQKPLKRQFQSMGKEKIDWEIIWGDCFQLRIVNIAEAFEKALIIKALIMQVEQEKHNKSQQLDVRIAIGLGDESFVGDRITENNGSAYIRSGELLAEIKKRKKSLQIRTDKIELDTEMNLYFSLLESLMEYWSAQSANVVWHALLNPKMSQAELGKLMGIKQSAVSSRLKRANFSEILQLNKLFRNKIANLPI
jgi:hypothetical protein